MKHLKYNETELDIGSELIHMILDNGDGITGTRYGDG